MTKQYELIGADGQEVLSETKGLLGGITRKVSGAKGLYGRMDCSAAR